MTTIRKPKPRKTPTTLGELVLDLDQRLDGGDASSDVWLPGTDWVTLCAAAEAEQRLAAARVEAQQPSTSGREAVLEAALDRWRGELAQALGAGIDTELPDLVEIAKGYAMALDFERDRYVRRVAELGNQVVAKKAKSKSSPAPSLLRCPRCLGACLIEGDHCVRAAARTRYEELRPLDPEHRRQLAVDHPSWFCQDRATGSECVLQEEHAKPCKTFEELEAEYGDSEHPECPHCGEADGHAPKDCAMRADGPTMVESVEREREDSCARRLNGQGWKRAAKQARDENALDTCHHCGVGETDVDGRDLRASRNDAPLPDGVFCGPCRKRLTANPREWERHSEEPQPKSPKKRRASKKFPLGDGLTEPCTACGRPFGDHAGQKCPPKQRQLGVEVTPF